MDKLSGMFFSVKTGLIVRAHLKRSCLILCLAMPNVSSLRAF